MADDDDRKSLTTIAAPGNVVATEVFTSPQLLKTIGSFISGVLSYIDALNAKRRPSYIKCNYAIEAITRGHVVALKALHRLSKQPPYCSQTAFDFAPALHHAAIHNQLEILQWLHDRGHREFLPSTLVTCVMRGHTAVVVWLMQHAPRCDAADYGQLAVLEAAERGDLEMLKALHTYGECSWFSSTVKPRAIRAKQSKVIEWLEQNRLVIFCRREL